MPLTPLQSGSGHLELLTVRVATMGGFVEHQLSNAIAAIEKRDVALARQVIDSDVNVDQRETEIEDMVFDLMERNTLTGRHLRAVIMALKIAGTLERIGDLAKNVAKRSLITSRENVAGTVTSVVRMGRIAQRQIHDVLDAFQDGNPDAALAVWGGDQELDELYNSIFREILTIMTKDKTRISAGTHLAFVAKNFERIGDHATSIAERVYYSSTGEHLNENRAKTDITSFTFVDQSTARDS